MTTEMATLLTTRVVDVAQIAAAVYLIPRILREIREMLTMRYDKLGPFFARRQDIRMRELDMQEKRQHDS